MTTKNSFYKTLLSVCFVALLAISAGCSGVEPDADATGGDAKTEAAQ